MKPIWLLLPLLLSACHTSHSLISNKPETPFMADGKTNDWGSGLLYNASKHLYYKVANDRHNLYLMVKFADENLVRKVLMTGFTVWIDTTNREKEKFGVTFPRGQIQSGRINRPRNPGNVEMEPKEMRMEDRLKESSTELEMHAYDLDEPVVMFLTESKLKPVISLDSTGALVYEFVLPFPYFIQQGTTSRPISIGFVIGLENTMNRSYQGRNPSHREDGEQDEMQGEGGGMGSGRRGGMNGGMHQGMQGGYGGRSGGGYNRNSKGSAAYGSPDKLWLKNYVLNSKDWQ